MQALLARAYAHLPESALERRRLLFSRVLLRSRRAPARQQAVQHGMQRAVTKRSQSITVGWPQHQMNIGVYIVGQQELPEREPRREQHGRMTLAAAAAAGSSTTVHHKQSIAGIR
jgi:hypothetical protein